MEPLHPADMNYGGITGYWFAWVMLAVACGLFAWALIRRLRSVRSGRVDPRMDRVGERIWGLITYGILQLRQPRYPAAGIIHLVIFWGFVVLGLRSVDLVSRGLGLPFMEPVMVSGFGPFYGTLKDFFELAVLFACAAAIFRRAFLKPDRYEGSRQGEAYLVLGLIGFLMITDISFEGSAMIQGAPAGGWLPAAQAARSMMEGLDSGAVRGIWEFSYWSHLLAFFFFLNLLPLSKHFHIITALPNVFLRKLDKGSIKPADWAVADMDELETLGVQRLEDFTWKHLLDFYTCTECGRCSDCCPAKAVGRPLSPKLISMKLRDYARGGRPQGDREPDMVGEIIGRDELWSCTTCGACEEECPVLIEYIDKIVDMRRHLVETARSPGTFNQPLMHVEKTGNPFGKPPGKRADWLEACGDRPVKILKAGEQADLLYFVDSYGSFDPGAQEVAAAIVRGLQAADVDFGILGERERDSGHQVRRMGEEGLFQLLVEENREVFNSIRFNQMITTDPHACNTFRNDYGSPLNVCHYTQFFARLIDEGVLTPVRGVERETVYTYHDPCYLGRHSGVYEEPRKILGSIPGLNLVEMDRSRDRSFCCGGADVILWHEIEGEEMRMAEKRLQMAAAAGADVIVTACPFCLIHFEDAVKTGGLEGKMQVTDLMNLLAWSLEQDH